MKKRIINIRVMTSIFIGLMAGILICYLFFMSNFSNSYLIVTPIIVGVIIVGFLIYAYLTRKRNELYECRKDVSKYINISTIGFAIAFAVGVLLTSVNLFKFKTYEDVQSVTVTGVVSDYVQDADTYKRFILDDCVIIDDNKVIHEDVKICIYTYLSADISLGDKIYFVGDLTAYDYKLNYEFDKLAQNISFSTYVNFSDMIVDDGEFSLKDSVKENVKILLDDNLNKENSTIAYSILFGEKQGLNNEIKEIFSFAGISHILAVSGLHIGVLVGILSFLLSKIKMNKYCKLAILSIILIFYCYLCSFSPSVLRASVMAILSSLCVAWQVEYDVLSSLSIAGIVVLIINPLNLFLISFQLSFLCVLGIVAFAPTLEKRFLRIKCPKFLASALAISISVNIIILPVCFNCFDYVSLLGIFSNIIVLPIFSIVYVMLFAFVVVGCLLPFVGGALIIPGIFLHLIKIFATMIADIDFGIFKVFHVGYATLFFLMIIYLIIHFLMVKKWLKLSFVSVFSLIFVIIFTINCIPIKYESGSVLVYSQRKSNIVFYVDDDHVTMVGSNIDEYYLIKQLKYFKIDNIDSIVAYDFQLNNVDNFNSICDNFGVKEVYLPNKFDYDNLLNKINNVKLYDDKLTIGNLSLENIVKDDIIGVKFIIEGKSYLIPELSPTIAESNYIENNYNNVDYIVVSNEKIKINLDDMDIRQIVTLNSKSENFENEINLKNNVAVNLLECL